jgi:ferredoxin
MALELKVDRIRCDGAGLCAELLPELVALDDWGYPMIRPGTIPPHLLDHARRAVDVCPVLALRLAPAPSRPAAGSHQGTVPGRQAAGARRR